MSGNRPLTILLLTIATSCSSSGSDSEGDADATSGAPELGTDASDSDGGGARDVGADSGAADHRSAGCGQPTTLTSGRYTIDVDGTNREYVIDVPSDYDPGTPYKLLFGWHPLGGSAQGIADDGFYGQKALAGGTMIFVAPEGRDGDPGHGWHNWEDSDVAFARAMVESLTGDLCIDESRIFSVGWSFGGMFSFTLGCGMADVFRAIAPMSGTLWTGCAEGSHPIAAWISHGIYDDFVNYTPDGLAARDAILARNHCSDETVPTDPSPCVSYQGCDDGYPVTWCAFEGHHVTPGFYPGAVWNFFSQF